jgi:hypothetical protein
MTIQQTIQVPSSGQIAISLPKGFKPGTKICYSLSISAVQEEKEDAFGIWKDRDITLASIRKKAWERSD